MLCMCVRLCVCMCVHLCVCVHMYVCASVCFCVYFACMSVVLLPLLVILKQKPEIRIFIATEFQLTMVCRENGAECLHQCSH